MSFWSWLPWKGTEETPNANTPGIAPASVGMTDYTPGDPHGLVIDEGTPSTRGMTVFAASGWDGWPAEWGMPTFDFQSRLNELIDIAWACLDLNSSVLSTMPVYRTRDGQVIQPTTWMSNPDPSIYSSWEEFAKQLFWDYQLGEAFVLPIASSGRQPLKFRVMPPWTIHVEMKGGLRVYRLGGETGPDVTDEILHIRYKSTTDGAHGVGPLEIAGARMLTAGVLARYVRNMATTGGTPDYTLETDQPLNATKAQELLDAWMTARTANIGAPPVLSNGVSLQTHQHMSPKDMAMLEISQFTEARIAVLLGVPPFLVGLPSGDSMTYSNVQQVFDFHDRSSLRPKARSVMTALSAWSLPFDEAAELNRDEYSRPALAERVGAYEVLHRIGVLSSEQIATMERFVGASAAASLSGGAAGATSGGGAASESAGTQRSLSVAEVVQKVYLGVGKVITSDEARQIVNDAGADLAIPGPPMPVAAAPPPGGGM